MECMSTGIRLRLFASRFRLFHSGFQIGCIHRFKQQEEPIKVLYAAHLGVSRYVLKGERGWHCCHTTDDRPTCVQCRPRDPDARKIDMYLWLLSESGVMRPFFFRFFYRA